MLGSLNIINCTILALITRIWNFLVHLGAVASSVVLRKCLHSCSSFVHLHFIFCFYSDTTLPLRSACFILSTFDSSLWTRRSDIWYSNSKSDSISDTATQKTVASIDEGWETWAGSDSTLGSIRLVDDVQEPGVLPDRVRPWLLQACKLLVRC